MNAARVSILVAGWMLLGFPAPARTTPPPPSRNDSDRPGPVATAEERGPSSADAPLLLDAARAGLPSPVGDPLPIQVEIRLEGTQEASDQIVVLVMVPQHELRWRPVEREHRGRLTLTVAFEGPEGALAVSSQPCPARLANDEIQEALGRSLTCGARLTVPARTRSFAAVLRDELANRAGEASRRLETEPSANAADGDPGSSDR